MNVQIPKGGSDKINHPEQLVDIMQRILLRENKMSRNQEHFWVVGLDGNSKLLFIELIGLGQTNRVHADSPTVFRMAIYKMAEKIIFVHNHPSGRMTASEADINLTDHQYKAGQMLNIELCDHIIISETGSYSFEAEGLMDQIKKSGLYQILSKEEQMLQEFKHEAEKDRAIVGEAKKIAANLKSMGLDEDQIKKATGLTKRQIQGL